MELFTVENLMALLTLTLLEVVLGIDNLVVLAIVTGKLPPEKQAFARRLGLGMAMLMRILLLLSLSWLMSLKTTLFTLGPIHPTARDLILIIGGLFLIGKATFEIHDKLEGAEEHESNGKRKAASVASAVFQITLLDIVFSLDSVITAIGMAREVKVMIVAIVIAILVMLIFVGAISQFIEQHPTIKILALSFLLLIGFVLVAEGFNQHVGKGYIYSSMGFALLVEMLNLKLHKKMVIPDTAAPYDAEEELSSASKS